MVTEIEAREAELRHIHDRIEAEIAGFDPERVGAGIADWNRATLASFRAALIEPTLIEVNLAGGVTDFAYTVTRPNGPYSVIWLPWVDVFSLAVESRFDPVDINVHGEAIACFSSV